MVILILYLCGRFIRKKQVRMTEQTLEQLPGAIKNELIELMFQGADEKAQVKRAKFKQAKLMVKLRRKYPIFGAYKLGMN